ncbi:hypothetical protein CHS0354_013285 [Potamilus streckersoni]|uniref:ribonuclease P n=1 Tax=Potamilus streckersoni TaxID=2493646 RepID=A0AAE0T0D5_9BIVA|nr:hypothetical protein CHS0354_013285 [Potamilus streckersoni]
MSFYKIYPKILANSCRITNATQRSLHAYVRTSSTKCVDYFLIARYNSNYSSQKPSVPQQAFMKPLDSIRHLGEKFFLTTDNEPNSSNEKKLIFHSSTLKLFMERLCSGEFRLENIDWMQLREDIIKENPKLMRSIDSVLMNFVIASKNVKLGVSFYEYLKANQLWNISVLASFIYLCGRYGGKEKQEYVLEAYEKLKEITPTFDFKTCCDLVTGFSYTDMWRKGVEFLEMSKITSNTASVSSYSDLIQAAIREGDLVFAVKMFEDCVGSGLVPATVVFDCFLMACKMGKFTVPDLLNLYRKYSLIPNETSVKGPLLEHFQSDSNQKWLHKFVIMKKSGRCVFCGSYLEKHDISSEKFEQLRDETLKRMLIQDDIYLTTVPKEFNEFKKFIAKNAPFDYVIDALNIMYKLSTFRSNERVLRQVVQEFSKTNKKVLVIGRKHIGKTNFVQFIQERAHLFLVENESKDDPFLIYAALYSGKSSFIVTSDCLRTQKFHLSEHMQFVFEKWQRARQIIILKVSENGRMDIKYPIEYDLAIQQDPGGWHIPYIAEKEDEINKPVFELTERFLCLRKSHLRQFSLVEKKLKVTDDLQKTQLTKT